MTPDEKAELRKAEELKHTCCGKADSWDKPEHCVACDVDLIRYGLGTVSMADAKAGHAALRRVYALLLENARLAAEVESLKHQLDDALSRADREEFRANMADPLFRPGDV